MRTMFDDEITLELARLQRAALANIRHKIASQQLGEAWVGLEQVREVALQSMVFNQRPGRA